MNVSPIASPAIAPTSFSAVIGINALAASFDPLAPPLSAAIDNGASVVELSNLGQLRSAAATFQAQLTTVSANSVAGQGAGIGSSFGKLVTATQLFVDTFNNLQTSSTDSLLNPLGAPFDKASLLALNEQSASGNGKSVLASLAQVGINFQEASIPGGAGQFNIDLPALQFAFNADPAGTSSLLAQAFQALGQLAAKLVGQNANLLATNTNSALLGSASVGQFDLSAFAAQLAALNGVNATAVNAALQRLLADLALSNALDANPTPAQTAVTVNAKTAADNNATATSSTPPTTSETIATTNLAMTQNIVTADTIPVAAAATAVDAVAANQASLVNPAVIQQDLAAENTALDASASNAGALQSTGIIAVPGNPAATVQNLSAASAAPGDATGTGTGTSLSGTQTLPDFNAARFLAIDPSVAAAIAAYRVGDGVFGTIANQAAVRLPEPITDIVAVTRIQPVTLDPHDGASDGWRNEAARNAVHSVDQRKAHPAFYDLLSSQRTVNVVA